MQSMDICLRTGRDDSYMKEQEDRHDSNLRKLAGRRDSCLKKQGEKHESCQEKQKSREWLPGGGGQVGALPLEGSC